MPQFYIILSVLLIIVCVLLILVVLVQNSKGGGLASNFSSSNEFMGVRKTADFLEKTTWTLAIAILAISLVSIFMIPKSGKVEVLKSEANQNLIENPTPGTTPINNKPNQ